MADIDIKKALLTPKDMKDWGDAYDKEAEENIDEHEPEFTAIGYYEFLLRAIAEGRVPDPVATSKALLDHIKL